MRSGTRGSRGVGNVLSYPLVRSSLVEIGNIGIKDALELPLMQDHQVIQAFLSHAPQEPFTDRIGSRGMIRGFEHLDATCRRHASKARPKFGIVIPNQVLWRLTIGRGFSELLRHPGIAWRSCHSDMDDLARLQFDEEEGKKRSK